MNKCKLIILIGICHLVACSDESTQVSETEIWKLSWRMVESSMDEKLELAEVQFDSLLELADGLERNFLITGLEVKSKLGKKDELSTILNTQNEEMLRQICIADFLISVESCEGLSEESIQNKELQLKLIKMYVDDQATRGNIMQDVITKYKLNPDSVTQENGVYVDEINRNKLRDIFQEVGFPTNALVGKDAMHGVFLIIQHADGDPEWQKSQFPKIENAVKNGDMTGQDFAYLYDRIQVNSGEKQRYGTQFANVDFATGVAELAETENIETLDERRQEMGMMPIDMYKRFMLKAF